LDIVLARLHTEEVMKLMDTVGDLWDEVDQRQGTMKLDPDWDIYRQLELEDKWFFYTATKDGHTSFYSFFIQPSIHVKGTLHMFSDCIYVAPEHRGAGVADTLIQASEAKGREVGVNMMTITLKDFDRHDSLVERLGYTKYENTFQRIL